MVWWWCRAWRGKGVAGRESAVHTRIATPHSQLRKKRNGRETSMDGETRALLQSLVLQYQCQEFLIVYNSFSFLLQARAWNMPP